MRQATGLLVVLMIGLAGAGRPAGGYARGVVPWTEPNDGSDNGT